MVRKFGYFRNLMRIVCVSVCAFCIFIGSALSDTCNGYMKNYVSATGTVTQNGIPTPTNPIEPVFYTQGNMVLRKVGTYADTYDAITGKITRNVGVKKFDGTENSNWSYDSSNQRIYVSASSVGMNDSVITASQKSIAVICSHFYSIANNISFLWSGNGSTELILFYYDSNILSISSATDWTNWLAAQYSAGTPVTVYYPLATPVTETWTETQYCENGGVQVATTKYVETAFSDSVNELNTTMGTIKNVVDNTIIQADRIGKLHAGKQTRPTGSCPEGRMCLLITESDGSLQWYPICGADGSVEPFDSNAWLTSLTTAGKPNAKGTQDSNSKWTYYNGFFKGMDSWRQQYADGSTWTYDRPFAHATRCTNPSYTTNAREASPCYTETGMYKTLTEGEWAVVYEGDEKASSASTPVDPGVIYGISKCVSTNLTGSVSYATKATAAQLADPLFSGIPTNQTDGADYKQCWCKMTAIGLPGSGTTTTEKAANGGIASVSGSAWVFYYTNSSAANCAAYCAYYCARYVRDSASFRSALVGVGN